MRSHQATSWASSSREKWTRPLVVGPSPVITPSRTTVSARAAVSRQEILEGSRAEAVSADMANGADMGVTLLKSQFLRFWASGVNDRLTIRTPYASNFTGMLICRGDTRSGSGPEEFGPDCGDKAA